MLSFFPKRTNRRPGRTFQGLLSGVRAKIETERQGLQTCRIRKDPAAGQQKQFSEMNLCSV